MPRPTRWRPSSACEPGGREMSRGKPVALVPGASSGCGAAFARALAARGDDLVVVARDETRLEELAETLEKEHGSAVEVLAADLSSKKGMAVVEARLESAEPPIDLLVNNAGMGTYGKFAELPGEAEAPEVRLNVLAVMQLSHAALAGMVERGRGGGHQPSSPAPFPPAPPQPAHRWTQTGRTRPHPVPPQ